MVIKLCMSPLRKVKLGHVVNSILRKESWQIMPARKQKSHSAALMEFYTEKAYEEVVRFD